MAVVHAEVFISQVSGERIRVGCLCGERHDHAPLIASLARVGARAETQQAAAR